MSVVSETALPGTVLAAQANYYQVRLDSAQELLCTRRSRLKKIGQQVMVGDHVVVEPDWEGDRGVITQVLPRRTELDRPPVANADQILVVFALEEPSLDPLQLSRFLVKAESTDLEVVLCLNKQDLVSDEQQAQWRSRLQAWGYQPILVSIQDNQGLVELQAQFEHKLTVVCGPSGVGKSSLIKHLIPQSELRVGEVSERWGKGRHTTRHVELFELPTSGLLADTPGFTQPALESLPQALASYFPEARQRLMNSACQFNNCLHRDEPNCRVQGNWERYQHYLDFLDQVIAQQTQSNQLSDPDTTVKRKAKGQGQHQDEPKLATKKYRRPSRRAEQQTLQKLYQDVEDFLPDQS